MITLAPQSYVAWTVGTTFVHTLAISATIFRLAHRFRTRMTWWDDYLVILPLVLDAVLCIAFWICDPQTCNIYQPGQPLKIQVLNSFWLTCFIFLTLIWSSRAVLSLSLVRIFPSGRPRQWTIALSIAMGVAWASSITVYLASCKQSSGFLRGNVAQDCTLANGVPIRLIYVATVDFASDLLLVITPLILFWRVDLPQAERRLILAVFCGSVLTLLAVVTYLSVMSPRINLGQDGATIGQGLIEIEGALSLLVCNLAVVSTCLYRSIRNRWQRNPPSVNDTPAGTQASSRTPPTCSCSPSTGRPATLSLTEISDFSVLTHTPYGTLSAEKSQPRELLTTFEEQKSSEGSQSQV